MPLLEPGLKLHHKQRIGCCIARMYAHVPEDILILSRHRHTSFDSLTIGGPDLTQGNDTPVLDMNRIYLEPSPSCQHEIW
jgi:hypothetical protein